MLKWFGIGEEKIFVKNSTVTGVITGVHTVWSVKVNQRIVRRYYLISFRYNVNGIAYRGKRYIGWFYRSPIKGEKFRLHIDPERPRHYAMHPLGPAIL